jgi:hypothetical protein
VFVEVLKKIAAHFPVRWVCRKFIFGWKDHRFCILETHDGEEARRTVSVWHKLLLFTKSIESMLSIIIGG